MKAVRPCWICGAPSDSREHKFKRTDLVRAFGDAPFESIGGVLHFVGDREPQQVQGPNAKRLKYLPSLCCKCNSDRSQPWDKSYEAFFDWTFKNQKRVLVERSLNLREIFGVELAEQSSWNLYRYFAKVLGCQMASVDWTVPPPLVHLLANDTASAPLKISFSVYRAMFARRPEHRKMYGIKPLLREVSASRGPLDRFSVGMQMEWLVVGIYYNMPSADGVGPPWQPLDEAIHLGEIAGPSLDEMIEDARQNNAPALAELEALRDSGGIRIE